MTGLFVVFEGGEGAGKSTQVAALAASLSRDGDLVVVTREPGGSVLGVSLRGLLLDAGHVPPRAEALLFAADRAVHADDIRQHLAAGRIVICDRYEDSSTAYQGAGRGLGEEATAGLSHWATGGLHADLTVLLDIDPRVGLDRAARGDELDRIERENLEFHTRVRDGFLALAGHRPGEYRDAMVECSGFNSFSINGGGWLTRYLVLDATRDCDDLAVVVYTQVRNLLRRYAAAARAMTGDVDFQYEQLLWQIRHQGVAKNDRTGVGTVSLFGCRLRYDLGAGFPLVTTKDVNFRAVAAELLWFLAGDTNTTWLREQGVHIWDAWADEDGNLGPVYGEQWRNWGGHVDQVANVLDQLRDDPDSRRMIVSAWNVDDLPRMALPPCHLLWQLYVAEGRLSCQVYQRSADMFLGVPYNLASYALLTHLLAQQAGLEPGDLIWVGGDCHIYNSHTAQVIEQGRRYPYPFPRLEVDPAPSIDGYSLGHFRLHDYQHHPALRAPVAV